jgi:hypothetical protein
LWEKNEAERKEVKKKRTMKTEILNDYYHLPEILRKKGFTLIINNLILENAELKVKWRGPFGETCVDIFERYFDPSFYKNENTATNN